MATHPFLQLIADSTTRVLMVAVENGKRLNGCI